MWIERLELQNYRQYQKAEVGFSPPGDQGFTVVQGPNGAGKTNILNAITWCLYGEECYLNTESEGLPLYHLKAGVREGDSVDPLEVKVTFRDSRNNRIVVSRRLNLRVEGRGSIVAFPSPGAGTRDGSILKFFHQVRGDMQLAPSPDDAVQEMLPTSIRDYFLFDGERLDSYFRHTSRERIHEAIFGVSQLDLLERTIVHLQRRRDEFFRSSRSLSPKASEARSSYDQATHQVEKLREELRVVQSELDTAEKRERELGDELKRIAPANISELQRQREHLDREIKAVQEALTHSDSEKRTLLLSFAPPILSLSAVTFLNELISKTAEAGEIPPAYRKAFLSKLVKDQKCICGRPLLKGSEASKAVQALADRVDVISEMSAELIEEGARARTLIADVRGFSDRLKSVNDRISGGETLLSAKNAELAKVQRSIGATNEKHVQEVEQELQRYRDAKQRNSELRGTKLAQLDSENKAAQKFKQELEAELRKEGRSNQLAALVDFCEKSLTAAEAAQTKITTTVKKEVEAQTKRYFQELIWKKGTYTDVTIDDDYNVSVIHQSGKKALGTLSAGERQILALSFVAALNGVSGFDIPLIIDTPLGRISEEPKHNIAANLPGYLKGKQVILLVTEEEYTTEVRRVLKPRVGKEWRILYRDLKEGSRAEVVPYGA